ncbi:ATP-binding cassette domain-containing protein [[Bacteroides] pectinophilus]|nr:ATP-binding cassette domain-containing protein [[Bacteroides] pectinophilus]UWN97150.1 ATP-binding cassette domain-containing protein [[Bacteroides] pectinophilus]
MLKINSAVKVFAKGTPNEHVALDSLNLTLNKGDFVTIVGSNGAGKSTLFNAICGTFLLDSGSIILDGDDITYMKEHKRSHVIGRVFQDPMKGTAPGMTIEENIALAYSRAGKPGLGFALNKKDKEFFRNALADFGMGLEDRMKTKVGLLSGGQRQVVTLLMCTLVPPKVLLLDEHTAALDPATAEKVMEITQNVVKKYNLTTMMITHNLKSAMETGNRTIMMDSGNIILDIDEQSRKAMSLDDLLKMYSAKTRQDFDNDRMLLTR